MFNELTEVPHVITMEISNQSDYLDLELPDGQRIWYTRVDHVPKIYFAEQVGEVSAELMSTVNTRLFMVIATN